MSNRSLTIKFLQIVFLFAFSFGANAADLNAGKTLFLNNCASCHAKDMKTKLTGPALAGAQARWGDDKELYAWIRNSQASIAAGQPRAVAIWSEYKPTVMTAFPGLKDEEIENMLAYINGVANGTFGGKKVVAGAATETKEEGGSGLLYGAAFAVLAGLALILARIMNNLNRTVAEKAGQTYVERSWTDALTSKGVTGFAVFALIVLGGFTTVNNAISLGRQQNYAPDQPIKFSHKTHAGLNKIDCQYCHDGARRSKHGSIPATNTCMNCHKAIKVGSQYKTAELTKIYVSAGWNPTTDKYIDDYDNMSQEDVAKLYKSWISSKYREERKIDTTAKVNSDERQFVDEQWNAIASSLKTEYKDKVQGPIQWKRIHNLPDHVYFNHAQHVAVGKVECQSCHGTVEKMDVLKQHSPLSMGWCINCHRQTEVKFKENDFYKSYEIYHEQVKKGTREKVTVEDIGGLECQKCHY
ncbi:MAG: cytochrome c3 family protein [Saprospiraceae bacterium]|nr:cytochrome c3 family protein [Saprospiraceae bacterium]